MTPTTLLYHRDPLLLTFNGVISAVEVDPAGRLVVLRETAFYPEAGGQMADHGALGGARVTDVQVGDDGVVRHVVEAGFAAAVGDVVAGVVDGARRRQHMAMHTAQHVLSQVLLSRRARAETVSARLGETVCTVDVDVASLSDRDVLEAEDAVHAIVDEDLDVTALFPDDAALAALPLRRACSALDCGAVLKQLVATHGGRGGGRADGAQGRLARVEVVTIRESVGRGSS